MNVQSWIYTRCLEVAGPQFSTDSGAFLPGFKSWLCPLCVCDPEQDLGPMCTLGSGLEVTGLLSRWEVAFGGCSTGLELPPGPGGSLGKAATGLTPRMRANSG